MVVGIHQALLRHQSPSRLHAARKIAPVIRAAMSAAVAIARLGSRSPDSAREMSSWSQSRLLEMAPSRAAPSYCATRPSTTAGVRADAPRSPGFEPW